jgi:hypothetical protein
MMPPPEKRQPSLDDLFALKRSEKPSAEFWDTFQAEFHIRQRAAAIEPKRWWFVLPRVLVGLSRYQMPVGAAAVLAVTFLSFREYREPGLEIAYTPTAPSQSETSAGFESRIDVAESPAVVAPETASVRVEEMSTVLQRAGATDGSASVSLSPMVVWAGVAANRGDSMMSDLSPSERSIAANLAAVRAEQPQLSRLLGGPQLNLTASGPVADPLSDVSVPSSAREPLFAYKPAGSEIDEADGDQSIPDIHSRIASRLNDDLLYDSVRRLTAGGDRLTLKF